LGNHSAERAKAVRRYLQATEVQSLYLDKILKKLAPKKWNCLKRTWKAGRWFQDTKSCFLGLATIWKLQVGIHIDPKDFKLSVITCRGDFEGGALYLTDLNMCH
jgi:hypothetical protein